MRKMRICWVSCGEGWRWAPETAAPASLTLTSPHVAPGNSSQSPCGFSQPWVAPQPQPQEAELGRDSPDLPLSRRGALVTLRAQLCPESSEATGHKAGPGHEGVGLQALHTSQLHLEASVRTYTRYYWLLPVISTWKFKTTSQSREKSIMTLRGARVAQSVARRTPGFCSGRGLRAVGSSPRGAQDSAGRLPRPSLPLSLSPTRSL